MTGTIRFETKTAYDQTALAVGQKVLEYRSASLRADIRRARMMIGSFGGMLVCGAGLVGTGSLPAAVVLAVIGTLCILVSVFYRRFLQFLSRKSVTGEEETARFGEDGFTCKSAARDAEHPYSDLTALYRSGRYLFLFIDQEHAYIADETRLGSGKAEELRAFLIRKTGKELIEIP